MVAQILDRTTNSNMMATNTENNFYGSDFSIVDEGIICQTSYENLTHLTQTEKTLKAREEQEKSAAVVKTRKLKVGYHHGKLTILPPNFAWPRMTTHQLVVNWLVGNVSKNLPPYCALSIKDVSHEKRLHKPFHEMKILMRYIECVARRQNCWVHNIQERTHQQVNNMWEKIGNKFIIDPFSKKTGRKKEISWKTVYNRLALAKEFSKSSSIYTKDPKSIVPIAEHSSSPLRNENDTQEVLATLVDKSLQENRPSSPPGLKDPPQQTTFPTPPENTENATNRPSDLIQTPNSDEDFEITNLQRNPAGMFEITKCLTCPATTQHRCTFPMPIGKYFDVDYGIRICGQAICNLCLGENNKKYRCNFHQFF